MQFLQRRWGLELPVTAASTRRTTLAGMLAVLGFSLLVIPGFNAFSLWLDEVNMASTAALIAFGRVFETVSLQPVLYFLLLRGWAVLIGQTDFALRAFSVLTAVLASALVFRIAVDFSRRLFAGVAATLLFGSMGFVRYHVHQVHIRGLVLLLTALLIFFYIRWWAKPRSWVYGIGLILASAASMYTHYYAAFILIALNIHALAFHLRQWRTCLRWLGLQAAVGLTLLPLAGVFFAVSEAAPVQTPGGETPDSIPPSVALDPLTDLPGVQESGGTVIFPNTFPTTPDIVWGTIRVMLFHREWLYGVLLLIGIAAVIAARRANAPPLSLQPVWLLLALMLGSLAAALTFNLWFQSFMDRRVIFLLPMLAILIAHLLSSAPRIVAWPALIAAVVIAFTTPRVPVLTGDWHYRDAIQVIERGWQEGDAILLQFNEGDVFNLIPLFYYAERAFPPHTPILTLGVHTLNNVSNEQYFANEVVAPYVWTRERFWVVRSGDPALGLDNTDWVGEIEGREFREVASTPAGWMVVALFAADIPQRPVLADAVGVPDRPELPVIFGDTFQLLDYQIDRLTVGPGDVITVWLDWQALAPPAQDYAVFLHLLEGDTILHGQGDGDARHLGREIAATLWAPGFPVYDQRALTVDRDTPPGVYRLRVGIYDRATFQRLTVILPDGTLADGLVLAEIEVR